MSIKVISEVWANSQLQGSELLLLLAIADHADDLGYAWPSVPRLARKVRVSERTAYRLLQRLLESGELRVVEAGGGRRSTRYQVVSAPTATPDTGDRSEEQTPDVHDRAALTGMSGGDTLEARTPDTDDRGEAGTPVRADSTPDTCDRAPLTAVSGEPSCNRHQNRQEDARHPRDLAQDGRLTPQSSLPGIGVTAHQAWYLLHRELATDSQTRSQLHGGELALCREGVCYVRVGTQHAARCLNARHANRASKLLSGLTGQELTVRFVHQLPPVGPSPPPHA